MYIKLFKPLIDFIIAICALPFFAIIYVIVAIAIKLDDGGPVFYMANRIGKNGNYSAIV